MSTAEPPPAANRDILLSDVQPGGPLVIGELRGPEDFRRRLYQRGFLPGATVKVVRRLPFGGPLEVEIRGIRVGLRRRDARLVTCQTPKPDPLG